MKDERISPHPRLLAMPKASQRCVVLCLAGQDTPDHLKVKVYYVDVYIVP